MNPILQQDLAQLAEILATTQREAQNILDGLNDAVVASTQPISDLAPTLHDNGAGFGGALKEFKTRFAPHFSGSAGPRYLGFVTGGATPAALAADWLTSAYDQNANTSFEPAGQNLERETVALLRQLFDLPASFAGVFVSGATMSNFVGLAQARQWLGQERGLDIASDGLYNQAPMRVLSGSAHSSSFKALAMLGMGRKHLVAVPTQENREAVDVNALEKALQENAQFGTGPCIVIANSGTVNTVDFDDLNAIAALKQRFGFWLHVDAAFGAFARLLPEHAHKLLSLEQADSLCIDLHKWLNVPYDSAVAFSKHQALQTSVFQNSAAYLGAPSDNPDLVHQTPENSRRLRALAAWFALRAYGKSGARDVVARNVWQAATLADRISLEPRLRLLAPARLNVVCFSTAPDASQAGALLQRIRENGQAFLSPTVYQGHSALRAAFSNWRTTDTDLEIVWQAIQDALPHIGLKQEES